MDKELSPPPIKPVARRLRELTFFWPPDKIGIYLLDAQGLRLVRMLRGVQVVQQQR